MVAGISVANARLEKSELYIYNFIYNKHSAILIYNVLPITFMGNLTPKLLQIILKTKSHIIP